MKVQYVLCKNVCAYFILSAPFSGLIETQNCHFFPPLAITGEKHHFKGTVK
jgi:hypothetical protein